MRRTMNIAAWVGLVVLGFASPVAAKAFRYRGMHPLPANGGGFCYLEVAHVHALAPSEPRVYRAFADGQVFVGDPVAYGYDGPKYTYYGPHPLVHAQIVEPAPVYCYLAGPHYHAAGPTVTAEASFVFKGGVYWYVGAFDAEFERGRPRYAVVNEVPPAVVYSPPTVDVTVAPPGFRAVVMVAPPPVRARVVVPPPPSLQFGIGVGVNLGGPTFIERERVIIRDRYHPRPKQHHDNGRHRGWGKQRNKNR